MSINNPHVPTEKLPYDLAANFTDLSNSVESVQEGFTLVHSLLISLDSKHPTEQEVTVLATQLTTAISSAETVLGNMLNQINALEEVLASARKTSS